MLFYSIIFLSIIIPLISPPKYKRRALLISGILLFIPWGLQYEVTQDWEPHLNHWNVANNGAPQVLLQREVEPIYGFILHLFAPIGFFNFLIVSAIVHIGLLFYLIKKNISPDYYWGSVAILILAQENGLLLINSNRQTWALIFTILGTLYIFEEFRFFPLKTVGKFGNKGRVLIGFSFYFMAIFIHGGAVTCLFLIPLFFISRRVHNLNSKFFFVVFYCLFFIRFFIDASSFQKLANLMYASTGLDNFEKYIDEIEMEEHISTVYNILFFIFMNLILITFKYMSPLIKFASLAFMVKILFGPYMTGNIQRILQYFWIYSIIVIPYIFEIIRNNRNKYKWLFAIRIPICCFSLALIIYDFIKTTNTSYVYDRWPDFKTIFEAPRWL